MSAYKIIEANTPALRQRWLDVVDYVYRDDPNYVRLLDMEIINIFTPGRQPYVREDNWKWWLLQDGSGKDVGRVAAFFDWPYEKCQEYNVGGIGYFECPDDQHAANLLLDTARDWLISNNIWVADAPINFGTNDNHWGCLVDGFIQPTVGMKYNLPYYEKLLNNYGFQLYFNMFSRHLDITKPLPEIFYKILERIKRRPGLRFETIKKDQLMKYGLDWMEIYNDAWKYHQAFKPMDQGFVERLIRDLKPVLFEPFVIFAYMDNEPAGFLFALPDLNQIFKPLKGKFSIWQKLLFWWRSRNGYEYYLKNGILTKGRVVIMGVKPKFQKIGLAQGLSMWSMEDAKRLGFKTLELTWSGDFNPMSDATQVNTGAELAMTHRTLRMAFKEGIDIRPYEKIAAEHRAENPEQH